MAKPWPERDKAPWGDGDPDGEHVGGGNAYKGPGPGEREDRAPAKSPDTDFEDGRPTRGGGSDSPVLNN